MAGCLVLGGSGALGGAVCRRLAGEGERVAIGYRTGEQAARTLERELPGSVALQVDIRDVSSLERAVRAAQESLGGIRALICCAGVGITVPGDEEKIHHRMGQVDEAAFDEMFSVNVRSTFFACRAVEESMRANGGGNIVIVGSIDGVKPVPAPVHYAASKGALGGMTQAMAKELGPHGIRVNVVAPGIMDGGLSRSLPDDLKREYIKHCGLKRLGKLDEIASLVCWLALHNTYVTGRTIVVDGAL